MKTKLSPKSALPPDDRSRPAVLITSTTPWPLSARLCMEFQAQGWRVEAICASNNPIRKLRNIARIHKYNLFWSAQSLLNSLNLCQPMLILPTDERAAKDLQELHGTTLENPDIVSDSVARSLAELEPISVTRWQLVQAAEKEQVLTPACIKIESEAHLTYFSLRQQFPWVLKAEGTFGGKGVRIVNSLEEAYVAFAELRRGPGFWTIFRGAFLGEADRFLLRFLGRSLDIEVIAQGYVRGRPANCAVACSNGRLIDIVSVEVVRSDGETGPATIVRLVEHEQMRSAADKIVRRLNLSGLCGFDFMIEQDSLDAYLIELNARPTRLCYLPALESGSLISSLSRNVFHISEPPAQNTLSPGDMVAYFPDVWRHDPSDRLLRKSYHDVPWEEPDLLRFCLLAPREERLPIIRSVRKVLRLLMPNAKI